MKFDKNIYEPNIKEKGINSLLVDKIVLISGDFWGIQKFIFERLSTKNASKVLRAKSAFIQIFTKYITRYICNYFGIEEKYIISESAGKFEILVPKQEIDIQPIQEKIDNYFRNNYYGINGIVLSVIKCKKEDFSDKDKYRKLRDKAIPHQIEIDRFKKFNLSQNTPLLKYDTNIDNQSLCKICNIRKIEEEEYCKICKTFIELGRRLTQKKQQEFKIKEIDNFEATIILDKRIKSYIPRDGNEALEFKKIAQNSCKGEEYGIKALTVLKADVDNMGIYLKDNDDITQDFESFDHFSQGLDSFFSEYIVDILREKDGEYRNIYTVFTGGDDMFLIGAWDETLKFARFIRNQFIKYVNKELTISFGMAVIKPTYPIAHLARKAEELLDDNAKNMTGKDAITLFGETVKWDNYLEIYENLEKMYNIKDNLNTSNLYTLLEISNMAIRVKYKRDGFTIRDALWKSKLRYLFNRNINKKYHYLIDDLNSSLENYPEETKMFLVEFIYKRRKA